MRKWTVLHVHNESSASGQDPEEEDLADGCKGLSSGSPLPMEFHSCTCSKLHAKPVYSGHPSGPKQLAEVAGSYSGT